MIIIFTIFGDSGLYHLHSLYNSKNKLSFEINSAKSRIHLLETEKLKLTNPDYLESILRKELGYIKDGEKVYQIIP